MKEVHVGRFMAHSREQVPACIPSMINGRNGVLADKSQVPAIGS
jgi:hypothetical protein